MRLYDKNIITGLEGCGKSSLYFSKFALETATVQNPILFAIKNYKLMEEQVASFCKRYELPEYVFAICGMGKAYEPALEAYTSPETPYVIPKTCRFIFCSQAALIRNHHLDFVYEGGCQKVKYSHICVDEFEFASCILPTLAYELERLDREQYDFSNKSIRKKLEWVERNYSKRDSIKAALMYQNGIDGFQIASWLEENIVPITFLTSEKLAVLVLEQLGFTTQYIESPDFTDCQVNVYSSPYINQFFFHTMNEQVAWNKLNCDLVITDKVKTYFESREDFNSLQVDVLSHMSIRGSNSHRDKKILTILSYIPPIVIRRITDALSFLGCEDIEFKKIEGLYYLDRCNQALGRVLGNRGSKNTDIITHSDLLLKIENTSLFPYSFNTDTDFEDLFEGFYHVLEKSKLKSIANKQEIKKVRSSKIEDLSYLDTVFEINPNADPIPNAQIKLIIESRYFPKVPATKVVKYFNNPAVFSKTKRDKERTLSFTFGLSVKKF